MFYCEWDETKAAINLEIHGISFEEASEVFNDPFRVDDENLEIDGEQRYQVIGSVIKNRILHVTYIDWIDGEDLIARIISARRATPLEREAYGKYR